MNFPSIHACDSHDEGAQCALPVGHDGRHRGNGREWSDTDYTDLFMIAVAAVILAVGAAVLIALLRR